MQQQRRSSLAHPGSGARLAACAISATVLGALPVTAQAQLVSTEPDLRAAIAAAGPGSTITLADGTYVLSARFYLSTAGTAQSRITVRALHQGAAIIDTNGNEEAFDVPVPYWVFDGLHVHVTHFSAHAFKLDTGGHDVIIRNGRIELESGSQAGIKGSGGPSAPQPDNALIENNEIWFNAPTMNQDAEGIDAVAVANWVIRRNVIHDIQKDSVNFDGIAYGAFTKGNSLNTVMEGNVFYNCFISMSLGGGGTAAQYFRDGDTTYEERNGILRNNVSMNSNDVAIYLNKASGARLFNNTIFESMTSCGTGCESIDVRFAGATASVINNILDKPVKNRDSGTHTEASNMMLPSPTDGSWFVNTAAHDFRLVPGAPPIDQGETLSAVLDDMSGTPRPYGAAYDIGASEWVPPGGGSDAGMPPPTPPPDGGTPAQDAGTPPPHDAGTPPPHDAGTPPPRDAGTPPPHDAGTPPPHDAGTPPHDAGTPPHDAGTPGDAGAPPHDGGGSSLDAGGGLDAGTLADTADGGVEPPGGAEDSGAGGAARSGRGSSGGCVCLEGTESGEGSVLLALGLAMALRKRSGSRRRD